MSGHQQLLQHSAAGAAAAAAAAAAVATATATDQQQPQLPLRQAPQPPVAASAPAAPQAAVLTDPTTTTSLSRPQLATIGSSTPQPTPPPPPHIRQQQRRSRAPRAGGRDENPGQGGGSNDSNNNPGSKPRRKAGVKQSARAAAPVASSTLAAAAAAAANANGNNHILRLDAPLKQQMLSQFIAHFSKSGLNSTRDDSWLNLLPPLLAPTARPELRTPVLAAALSLYGNALDNRAALVQAHRWYGDGLRRQHARLRSLIASASSAPPPVVEDVMIIVVLAYYEVTTSTDRKAYFQHLTGATAMLARAGPAACRSGFFHHIFQTLRLHMVYVYYLLRRPSVFTEDPWMSLPFEEMPRTACDRVIDLLTFFPGSVWLDAAGSEEQLRNAGSWPFYATRRASMLNGFLRRLESLWSPLQPFYVSDQSSQPPASPCDASASNFPNSDAAVTTAMYAAAWLSVLAELCALQYQTQTQSLYPPLAPDGTFAAPPPATVHSAAILSHASSSTSPTSHQSAPPQDSSSSSFQSSAAPAPSFGSTLGATPATSTRGPTPYRSFPLKPLYGPREQAAAVAHAGSVLAAAAAVDEFHDGCSAIRVVWPLRCVLVESPEMSQRESAAFRLERWRRERGMAGICEVALMGTKWAPGEQKD